MCKDILHVFDTINVSDTETQLILQCAPVIAGLKCSNLLKLPIAKLRVVLPTLAKHGLCCATVYPDKKRAVFLVYRREELCRYFSQRPVREMLGQCGYTDLSCGRIICRFAERYAAYMERGEEFPHEIGLLLGYPIEDVVGFIENNGRNFLYSGYWKVYRDAQGKRWLFRQIEREKERMLRAYAHGDGLEEILGGYRGNFTLQEAM